MLEEGEDEDGPDLAEGILGGDVEVRTLDERGFLTYNRGLAIRWPNGQELTVEIGCYTRASA